MDSIHWISRNLIFFNPTDLNSHYLFNISNPILNLKLLFSFSFDVFPSPLIKQYICLTFPQNGRGLLVPGINLKISKASTVFGYLIWDLSVFRHSTCLKYSYNRSQLQFKNTQFFCKGGQDVSNWLLGKWETELDVSDPPASQRNTGRSKNNLQFDAINCLNC